MASKNYSIEIKDRVVLSEKCEDLPKTLGKLKKLGYEPLSVKEEMRQNLIMHLKNDKSIFPSILGYDKTVIPQMVNAILSRHHIILLGLRGQGKTKMIRQLMDLLDTWLPVIDGLVLHEDPLAPISPKGKQMIKELGDDTPISWLHRSERYHEKLATPDVSIADLIGDIDPIKAAREKLDISNEEVIHWGIIPRSNRGIFAINELPDLQPRIQVGLFNILEENDIQVRGFPIRLPLDMMIVFSANPEDYTNRGNIITPLKDRIDSQILTHYPLTMQDAKLVSNSQLDLKKVSFPLPSLVINIIEGIAFVARKSEYIDQMSGVSVRMVLACYENYISSVEKRCLLMDEMPCPRLIDLYSMIPSITGKIELVHEGDKEGASKVATSLIAEAIHVEFSKIFPKLQPKKIGLEEDIEDDYAFIREYFRAGGEVMLSLEMTNKNYEKALEKIPRFQKWVADVLNKAKSKVEDPIDMKQIYLYQELVLEAMHYVQMISRRVTESNIIFLDAYSRMIKNL